jgi:hypothetical protein
MRTKKKDGTNFYNSFCIFPPLFTFNVLLGHKLEQQLLFIVFVYYKCFDFWPAVYWWKKEGWRDLVEMVRGHVGGELAVPGVVSVAGAFT